MAIFLAALGGAIVGSLINWLFALWRTVVEGQAAARVVRSEILENTVKVDLALGGKTGDLTLSNDGWRAHRSAIALLLGEAEWFELCREIGFVHQAQIWIDRFVSGNARETAREHLQVWQTDLRNQRKVLGDMEYSGRLPLMLRLLRRDRKAEEEKLLAKLTPLETSPEQPVHQEASHNLETS